jgi:predicted MFS family arabinose efflux permease
MLLFFYAGFLIGTFLCGIAPTYHFLLLARMVTGLFGGVIGSISFAIIADLFPFELRGRVMGSVQTAFAASQVMGIPLGLWLSDRWGWHAPFLMIVAISALVGVAIVIFMRPVDGHLRLARPPGGAFRHLGEAVARREYLRAYAATTLLVTGGFMLMPYGSAFTVNNMGIPMNRLFLIYMVTGLFSMFAGPLIGRISDNVGKFKVFAVGSLVSMIMVLVFTHMGVTPLSMVIGLNVLLMTGITSRMVSASALTSAVPEPRSRGSFMSVNASVQQISGGVAAGCGGLIVSQDAQGRLLHYDLLGYVVVAAMLVAIGLLYRIHLDVKAKTGTS